MQKNHWLRVSLATMILAGVGAGATLQGCSDDDDVTPIDAGKDTATVIPTGTGSNTNTPPDADVPDTFVPPKPAVQKIIFVHAANYMGAAWETGIDGAAATNGSIRLCLRSGKAGDSFDTAPFLPIPPLPNAAVDIGGGNMFTGLLRGTGGVLPASTDFATSQLTGYALNARILATKGLGNATCGDIFAKGFGPDGGVGDGGVGGALVDGVDYLKVGEIPANTFANEKTYIITVQGCAKGAADSDPRCGAGYSAAAGNLKLKVQEVSRGVVAATELGVQFVQATPSTGTFEIAPGVLPGAATDGGADGGGFKAFAAAPTAYDAPITAQAKLTGVSLTNDGVLLNQNTVTVPIPPYSFPSTVAATAAKTPVALGTSHVFVLVGDVQSTLNPAAPPNQKFHFVAFPANPAVPQLTQ